jgi:hypothetical protein
MHVIVISIFSLLISQPVYSRQLVLSDSLAALLNLKENEMFSVITNGNKEAAEKLIAQEYITINADGVMEGKENTIKTLGKFKGSTAKLSDKKIRIYDNTVIINGKAKFYLKQILVAEIFYTEIWNYRNRQWQFIGWQGTMTGIPSYYPVIVTIIVLLLLHLIIKVISRKRKAKHVAN